MYILVTIRKKKEEIKISRSLKLLGYETNKIYDKQLQKQLRVWIKEDSTRQPRLAIDKVLDKVKVLSDKELDKLDNLLDSTDLSSLPDNIQEKLDNNYIEINQLKQENTKLLQANLDLANKLTKEATPVKEVAISGKIPLDDDFLNQE